MFGPDVYITDSNHISSKGSSLKQLPMDRSRVKISNYCWIGAKFVILKDVGSANVLPIWVGIYEANAIALEIEKVSTPRPMTHDLIKTLLLGLDAGIQKVVVNELRDDTFFAVIWVQRNGELISVDSRPSVGTRIEVRTPLVEPDDGQPGDASQRRPSGVSWTG